MFGREEPKVRIAYGQGFPMHGRIKAHSLSKQDVLGNLSRQAHDMGYAMMLALSNSEADRDSAIEWIAGKCADLGCARYTLFRGIVKRRVSDRQYRGTLFSESVLSPYSVVERFGTTDMFDDYGSVGIRSDALVSKLCNLMSCTRRIPKRRYETIIRGAISRKRGSR